MGGGGRNRRKPSNIKIVPLLKGPPFRGKKIGVDRAMARLNIGSAKSSSTQLKPRFAGSARQWRASKPKLKKAFELLQSNLLRNHIFYIFYGFSWKMSKYGFFKTQIGSTRFGSVIVWLIFKLKNSFGSARLEPAKSWLDTPLILNILKGLGCYWIWKFWLLAIH